ncbi:hypothetical protein [Paenibacillus sp. BK720]|jgi:hypothetical protein|uniref:Uncharacterized protein n=1 Tax=Paenibacillus glycanilyticus TaxID=126569 RepID=A0ABQ6NJE9_9BACL|nr:hypothetical protein [Paenibacillus sp. BK720]GMK45221.1 hypothetical protein PghCCS26_23490 [Paenibacillus glycanilyticus]
MEGDGEANYAHYALHQLYILPGQFVQLPREEKAFIMASIDIRIKKEKEAARKR